MLKFIPEMEHTFFFSVTMKTILFTIRDVKYSWLPRSRTNFI